MSIIFIISFILSVFFAFFTQFIIIHQSGALEIIGGEVNEALPSHTAFITDYGHIFRTYKHCVLDGTMVGFFCYL